MLLESPTCFLDGGMIWGGASLAAVLEGVLEDPFTSFKVLLSPTLAAEVFPAFFDEGYWTS